MSQTTTKPNGNKLHDYILLNVHFSRISPDCWMQATKNVNCRITKWQFVGAMRCVWVSPPALAGPVISNSFAYTLESSHTTGSFVSQQILSDFSWNQQHYNWKIGTGKIRSIGGTPVIQYVWCRCFAADWLSNGWRTGNDGTNRTNCRNIENNNVQRIHCFCRSFSPAECMYIWSSGFIIPILHTHIYHVWNIFFSLSNLVG